MRFDDDFLEQMAPPLRPVLRASVRDTNVA
jgi:hypothetical protein